MNTSALTTAQAFNDASKEFDWGYVIAPDGDRWKLSKTDGTFICSTPKEHWAILFGRMHTEIDNLAAG